MPCPEKNVIDRFVLKTRAGLGGCILWTGGRLHGYGSFSIDKKTRRAHRVAYELFVGPIPDGLFVLHNCPRGDNRLCVNPAHLWLGTGQDNMDDMVRKGRQARQKGVDHGNAKLTEADVATIRRRCRDGESQYRIAADIGIRQPAVSRIVSKKRWGHVP